MSSPWQTSNHAHQRSWEAGTESNLTPKPFPDLITLDYGLADFGLPYQHPRAKTERGNLHLPLTALVRRTLSECSVRLITTFLAINKMPISQHTESLRNSLLPNVLHYQNQRTPLWGGRGLLGGGSEMG